MTDRPVSEASATSSEQEDFMSTNYYLDNDDLRFHIERAFDWSEILALFERNFTAEEGFESEEEAREFFRDILDNVGKYVAAEVAPRVRDMDNKHPQLEDGEVKVSPEMGEIFEGFKEMGLYALNLPRELGGLNAPMTLYFVIAEMLSRADPALLGHYGFHGGIAMSLLAYSMKEGSVEHNGETLLKTRWDDAITEIAAGENFGCMVLTEADAGSDLSAIRTKGVLGEDGKWRVTGQKIFITSGHGQYQLVLAKTENTGNGLKDLSLFMVPRKIERDGEMVDNVEIERLEDKLGIHASITCTLAYDESEAELIGKRGQGFELMLMLMNNARLGVGFEAIGLIEGAYRMAVEYAAERKSMGKPILRHEMIADYLDRMDAELRGLRAVAFSAAHAVDLYNRLEWKLQLDPPADEKERKELERRIKKMKWRARELTPLIKYEAGEKAVDLARLSLQIHGGVGYTTDYLIEKFFRDAVVLPIYEGTSQVQALMALKDQLGAAIKDPAGFVRRSAQARIQALSARDPLERKLGRMQTKLYGAMQHILTRIARDKWHWVSEKKMTEWAAAFLKDWDPRRDFAFGLLHAERLTRILVACKTAEVLVDQAKRFPERRELAERYIERTTPDVNHMHDEILHTGDRLVRQLGSEEEPGAEEKSA
jgi:alkylation response protein AidB-like acyl-CoA dehydrogenase